MNTESSVENTVHEYAAPQMPLKDYACLVGIFGTLLTGTLLLSRVRKTELRLTDIVLIGLATHKLSRMVAKDRVTSPFRAPFAKYVKDGEPGEVEEESRGQGAQKAVGDLVTCPYCMSLWVAWGLLTAWVVSPKTSRMVCGLFSAVASSHFLHKIYTNKL